MRPHRVPRQLGADRADRRQERRSDGAARRGVLGAQGLQRGLRREVTHRVQGSRALRAAEARQGVDHDGGHGDGEDRSGPRLRQASVHRHPLRRAGDVHRAQLARQEPRRALGGPPPGRRQLRLRDARHLLPPNLARRDEKARDRRLHLPRLAARAVGDDDADDPAIGTRRSPLSTRRRA